MMMPVQENPVSAASNLMDYIFRLNFLHTLFSICDFPIQMPSTDLAAKALEIVFSELLERKKRTNTMWAIGSLQFTTAHGSELGSL